MSKQANKKVIGAFVVVGLALALAAVVVFGSGKFFTQKDRFVAYFEGSVKGLRVGAPVVFRGVDIGQVTKIMIFTNRHDRSFQIPVILEIDPDNFKAIGPEVHDRKQYVKDLIEVGLRATLQLQSLVTGQLMINLDFYPDTPVRLVGNQASHLPEEIPEIPTIQTPLQKIEKTLEDIPIGDLARSISKSLQAIESIITSKELSSGISNFEQATKDIRDLARNLDAKVNPLLTDAAQTLKDAQSLIRGVKDQVEPLAASFKQTSDTAAAALKDARKLLNDVDRQVQPLAENLEKALKAAYQTLKKAEASLGSVNGMLLEGSPLRFQVETTFNELAQAARSIRVLAEFLERNPDALLRGKSATGGY